MVLLDESLDMEPHEREAWLARQEVSDPALTTVLRNLLAAQSSLEQQGFLDTLVPIPEATPAPDAALVDRQFGPYRIVSILGHGGMGSVWLAERMYQHGRALLAKGEFASARQDLEQALGKGYRAARVDLGMLLSLPSGGMLDPPRAIELYKDAWNKGMTIAAFNLGNLYENGIRIDDKKEDYLLAPDASQAWAWYQKAADAGEPNALARLAQRAEAAAAESGNGAPDAGQLLQAFAYYAAAAERARGEDWPDDSWRNWRYRRAYLARKLAREGKMQEVADSYEKVRKQYGP